MIVVDTNVLAARVLEHEKSVRAAQVERRDPVWIAPFLWRYEFQNILAKAIWTNRLTADAAAGAWNHVMAMMTDNENEPSVRRVIDLCAHHHVTAYDASFVALAEGMGVVLVTEDAELIEKFQGLAMSMEAFVRSGRSENSVRESRGAYRARKH